MCTVPRAAPAPAVGAGVFSVIVRLLEIVRKSGPPAERRPAAEGDRTGVVGGGLMGQGLRSGRWP
ncbi:hypothetical protein ACFFX0_18820 [Citricoccus parietis]|uniref:Uncharacterized protein n=1 Tax=Citricoccus parietis TaxID=592307 RepID=A0ABV5G2I6_9MICC